MGGRNWTSTARLISTSMAALMVARSGAAVVAATAAAMFPRRALSTLSWLSCLARSSSPDLLSRPSLVIKVLDPLMQGVPLGPSLGQPGVGVLGDRADNPTQIAHKGHGLLLHGGGLNGKASIVGGQGVKLLSLLLHGVGLKSCGPHAEGPLA